MVTLLICYISRISGAQSFCYEGLIYAGFVFGIIVMQTDVDERKDSATALLFHTAALLTVKL